MGKQLTPFVRWARQRYPKSFKQGRIFGDGPFCLVGCCYWHPQVGFQLGAVQLFQSEIEALTKRAEIDLHHCGAKGECQTRNHYYVDLRAVAR
jgi:hypothetical protein